MLRALSIPTLFKKTTTRDQPPTKTVCASREPTPFALDAHIRDEDKFDWNKAENSGVWYSYSEGDTFHFSVGKPDWTSLLVLMSGFAGRARFDVIMKPLLQHALWLRPTDSRYQSWQFANNNIFIELADRLVVADLQSGNRLGPGTELLGMRLEALSYAYRHAWMRCKPMTGDDVLLMEGVNDAYWNSHAKADADAAATRALSYIEEIAWQWLASRGCEVDKDQRLVRVNGYQPLILVEEQSY
jgi:hypothetical protein